MTDNQDRRPPLEPLDPRDLTLTELGLLSSLLKKESASQRWAAEKPGIPARRVTELREAAERRRILNIKLIRIRKFIKDQNGELP